MIDADKRTVRTRCVGEVTLPEVVDHFLTLRQDPDRPDRLDVFLDLAEMESVPGSGQISMAANEVRKLSGQVRFGACAIVAPRDALFGMMRVFEVMAEQCFRVSRTFRTAHEAESWLVLQQSLADEERRRAG